MDAFYVLGGRLEEPVDAAAVCYRLGESRGIDDGVRVLVIRYVAAGIAVAGVV